RSEVVLRAEALLLQAPSGAVGRRQYTSHLGDDYADAHAGYTGHQMSVGRSVHNGSTATGRDLQHRVDV
ncbi:hypothetical protein AAVH_29252, partial [Aphelenchoides avenae]